MNMMKYFKMIMCVAMLLMSSVGCKKFTLSALDFNVAVSTLNYKVGDTVNFIFSGNPDYITFYSGEIGYNHDFINRTSALGTPQLQFMSYVQNPATIDYLQIKATNNLKSWDSTGIANANWINITNRAILSTGKDSTQSGIVGLNDFLVNDSFVLALKYSIYVGSKYPVASKWTIRGLTINNVLPDSSIYTIATIGTCNWTAISTCDTSNWYLNQQSNYIQTTRKATTVAWALTAPFKLNKVTPDVGISIKTMGGATLTSYPYIYSKPGTYKATFLAINANAKEEKQELRQVVINVSP